MGGFNAWEPIFIYGKTSARIGQDYIKVNTLNFNKGPEKKHPCPKPIALWEWLLEKFSKEGDIVLDPFIGSGTTAVVAQKRNRQFVGMDFNPEYIRITEQRLAQKPLNF
jgi:DNA modification methylase